MHDVPAVICVLHAGMLHVMHGPCLLIPEFFRSECDLCKQGLHPKTLSSHLLLAQVQGTWQQLPRIPHSRTSAEMLADANSPAPKLAVQIHAR